MSLLTVATLLLSSCVYTKVLRVFGLPCRGRRFAAADLALTAALVALSASPLCSATDQEQPLVTPLTGKRQQKLTKLT